MASAVMYSGGACSYMAAKRWVEAGNTPVFLFSDTGEEDPDLYKFLVAGCAHLGIPLMPVRAGVSFDEMIVMEKALPSDRMPFCSRILKVEPAKKWLEAHPEITTLVFGMDWTETHRLPSTKARWPNHTVVAPMMEPPYLFKSQMLSQLEEDRLPVPRLYKLGFQHNNCGGGCVRNGLKGWNHLHAVLPDVFERWATREELVPGHSFSRDRRFDPARPITLRQIAREADLQSSLDWGGCGCFIDEEAAG